MPSCLLTTTCKGNFIMYMFDNRNDTNYNKIADKYKPRGGGEVSVTLAN